MAIERETKLTTSGLNKNKVNNIVQDINKIEQIDKIKSRPVNQLDFTTQDRLYSEVKKVINTFLNSQWNKNIANLGKFESWLEFPEGTPNQKTLNASGYVLAKGGKTSSGKNIIAIAIMKKLLNEAIEANDPRKILVQLLWQSTFVKSVLKGKNPIDSAGAVTGDHAKEASSMGFTVSKGKGRHAGFNVYSPSEALTRWIDDQKFDENKLLVQLSTLYTAKKKTRGGSPSVAMSCECFSVRGNKEKLTAWIAIVKTCPVCKTKFQIK